MSVSKNILYSIWAKEKVNKKRILAVKEYVYSSVLNNFDLSDGDIREVNQKLNFFVFKLNQNIFLLDVKILLKSLMFKCIKINKNNLSLRGHYCFKFWIDFMYR